MGLLPDIKRTKYIDDAIAQVQTNLDNTPKQFGTPVLVYTRTNNGSDYTETGYVVPSDGIIDFKSIGVTAEQATTRWSLQVDSGAGFVERAYCFSTGHGNAQYWQSLGDSMSLPVRAGWTIRIVRLGVNGTQDTNDTTMFTPWVA